MADNAGPAADPLCATVTMPVYFRVGDGEECNVGSIEADSAKEALQGMAGFLRAAAEAIEAMAAPEATVPHRAPEAG